MNQQNIINASIYRWPTVKAVTGLSRSTCWRLQKKGNFPLPVRLSIRAIGWRKSDIDAWLESRTETDNQEVA